jgi:Beta-lactamase
MDGQPAPAIAVSGATLGAGALHSSIRDLPLYLLDNIDPSGTKLASALEMTEQRQSIEPTPKAAMGPGWIIDNAGTPAEQFAKDGATAGFTSCIAFSKNTRTGFVVVCNGHNVSKSLAPQINKLLGASETESDDSQ